MALIDLYDGIAVVIDDEIHDSESGIGIIVKHLEDRNIPVVMLRNLGNDSSAGPRKMASACSAASSGSEVTCSPPRTTNTPLLL